MISEKFDQTLIFAKKYGHIEIWAYYILPKNAYNGFFYYIKLIFGQNMDFLNSVSVEIHFPLRIALLSLVKSCLLNKRLLVNNARPRNLRLLSLITRRE